MDHVSISINAFSSPVSLEISNLALSVGGAPAPHEHQFPIGNQRLNLFAVFIRQSREVIFPDFTESDRDDNVFVRVEKVGLRQRRAAKEE